MNWAENIKKLRNKMLLTQQELAKLLNVAYVSINRWENGVTQPNKLKEYAFEQFCVKNNVQFSQEKEIK